MFLHKDVSWEAKWHKPTRNQNEIAPFPKGKTPLKRLSSGTSPWAPRHVAIDAFEREVLLLAFWGGWQKPKQPKHPSFVWKIDQSNLRKKMDSPHHRVTRCSVSERLGPRVQASMHLRAANGCQVHKTVAPGLAPMRALSQLKRFWTISKPSLWLWLKTRVPKNHWKPYRWKEKCSQKPVVSPMLYKGHMFPKTVVSRLYFLPHTLNPRPTTSLLY